MLTAAVIATNFVLTKLKQLVKNFHQDDSSSNLTELNTRPIIGILAQETYRNFEPYGDSYILSSYVKFVQGSGARAVPIRIGEPESYYTDLLSKINGVLFPGGAVDPLTSKYATALHFIVQYAIQAHDKGDYFPLFGICQGFESIAVTMVGENILSAADAERYPIPLEFTENYANSRMFGELSPSMYDIMSRENVTPNAHHWCITPSVFYSKPELHEFFKVLANNKDRNGVEFISAMEAYNYPIYAVIFHPEKNTYTWSVKSGWLHTGNAIKVTQYFANFFVNECRKNTHCFPDLHSEHEAFIGSYTAVLLPEDAMDKFEQIYVFNFTDIDVEKESSC